MMNEDFWTFFRDVQEAEDTNARASLLISLCKRFDLRDPAFRPAVDEIAQWITSSNSEVRRAAMFSLCYFRPIQGLEWVLLEGWRRSDALDLHWYASGIEIAYDSIQKLEIELVLAVADTLFRQESCLNVLPPNALAIDLEAIDAWDDCQRSIVEVMRVFHHILRLFDQANGRPVLQITEGEAMSLDWSIVARVLYHMLQANFTNPGNVSTKKQ